MIALLQRVSQAFIEINRQRAAEIGQGLVVLIGVEKDDERAQADRLLERVLGYRVFADANGKMNLSLSDINAELLWVPQFTLAADTRKGMRPSFTPAATPDKGRQLFDYLVSQSKKSYDRITTGRFGADMQVSLTNDGPVTFWLQV